MTGPQRAPTPYPSHFQTLEESFMAGIIEMPTLIQPILSFPSQQESNNSLLEFLDEGGFCYPFAPLSHVTHRLFLIPGPSNSSSNDAVVLHQFPGPIEVPPTDSEASTSSYHMAPIQFFPSSLPMAISSSLDPDHPHAESSPPDFPSIPPLTSNVSDNGSLSNAPNLQLLANVSKYITASEGGHSSDSQEFVVYNIDPLECILPYFPGAYANFITQPPMGIPLNGNPAFRLRWILTMMADALCTAEPVGNWNSLDKEWEEDTWEYLLMRDDNVLESLWASLQDLRDPGLTNEVDHYQAIDAEINLLLAACSSINAELLHSQEEISQCQTCLKGANLEEQLKLHEFPIITPVSGTMPQ
ncbi:uncharacterized protein FIBRA_09146 [Fibroporia radiculosa]|uniref:Uncharacterized protein n=1 Tax=Fibroporia radiculosa TaxID=599839 RepID=J4GJ02_9APHY|nr:uncharacterized protein FIBRA_09146 [Fibroporia radiculosa]CCM06843.1 predicted protein [Fibroporia radiculosa]